MRRPRPEVAGVILFVELLTVASLRAGQDQGSRSDPPEVRATSEAKPVFNTEPADVHSYLSLAKGRSGPALWAGVNRNQTPEFKPKSARRSPLLIVLYVSYGILQALDAQSTIRALHSGSVREVNPLVRPFAGQPAALVGFKLGVTAGTIYGTERLHKSHPRLAMITLSAITAAYLCLVVRDYQSFSAR